MLLALVFSCSLWAAFAQTEVSRATNVPPARSAHSVPSSISVEFSFVPRQPSIAPWRVRIDENLTGQYRADGRPDAIDIRVSESTKRLIDAASEPVQAHRCETKAKNVAASGEKTITFASGSAQAACIFNYSDDEALNAAAHAFQAIVETLRLGDKLAHDRRFDRLGLNADLDALTAEAKAGEAIELQNIAPLLQSIANNDDLMEVVRRRAQSLLQDASLKSAQ